MGDAGVRVCLEGGDQLLADLRQQTHGDELRRADCEATERKGEQREVALGGAQHRSYPLGTRQGHRSGHAARSPVYGPIGLSGRGYGPGRLVRFTTQDRGIGRMPRPPGAFFVVLIRAPVPVSARPRGCATPILRDADTGPRRGCSYRDRVAATSPVQVTLRLREAEDLVEAKNALCLAQVAEA